MTALVPYSGIWSPEAVAGKAFINVDFSDDLWSARVLQRGMHGL